ncbi:MAG: T9SS type A sorting domain-containing protein [Bacteroidia bacterium]
MNKRYVTKSCMLSGLLFRLLIPLLCSGLVHAQTISRGQIHSNAMPFTTYSFTASSANIQSGSSCPSAGGNVTTPSWVVVGHNAPGMAYCWGGFSSLSSFTSGLTSGKSAGDNDCTTNGDCCESCALGVDCSGFVSHAWGLSTKYSTSTIPNISTAYSSASMVKQGDVFNLAGSHVRLVDTNYASGTFLLMESSAVDWKVSYRSYTASQLTSYTPRWYVNVDTAAPVCHHFYATLPYTNSFETIWGMDSCNNGAQRSPDHFWKSNIGGTTPAGNDFWHRNDYTGTDWTSPSNGAYSPAASNGSFSARFHNDPSPAGSTGQMDLYLDLSNAGAKTIKFDYLHNEASPSPFAFNVLLSTDGGLTFPNTLLTITSAQVATWTTQTVTTSLASATCVLRFTVTDKGSMDVGVDNLNVSMATVTGIAAQNSVESFNLFPNPNDGNTLNGTVPESDQHTMNVRIYNMVGSEVIARQVPVDGTNFSVQLNKELSAGIYLFVGNCGEKQFRRKIIIR